MRAHEFTTEAYIKPNDKELIRKVKRAYKQGLSYQQIQDLVGINFEQLRGMLDRHLPNRHR